MLTRASTFAEKFAADAHEHVLIDATVACVVLVHSCFVIYSADLVCSGQDQPAWLHAVTWAFIMFYSLEISLRIFAYGWGFFRVKLNLLEFAIVSFDIVFQVAMDLTGTIEDAPALSIFRFFRILRVVRILREYESLRELWLMLEGVAAAMRAALWASLLVAFMLIVLSVLSVGLLHPVALTLECKVCESSFSSTREAMLTWFCLIFTGNLWEELAIPMIQHQPLTVPFYIVGYVLLNFGMLNLILTVIVDKAHEAREQDMHHRVLVKERQMLALKEKLSLLCDEMDDNKNGTLTTEELKNGSKTNTSFSDMLAEMDVGADEVDMICGILDEDRSGTISHKEFVDQLYKIKSQADHTLLVLIRYNLGQLTRKLCDDMRAMHRRELQDSQADVRNACVVMANMGIVERDMFPSHPNKSQEPWSNSLSPQPEGTAAEAFLQLRSIVHSVDAGNAQGSDSKTTWVERPKHVVDGRLTTCPSEVCVQLGPISEDAAPCAGGAPAARALPEEAVSATPQVS